MSTQAREREPQVDDENPEWTEADFARAKGPEALPPEILAQFPNTKPRGRPRIEAPKEHVSIRLSPRVLAHFKAKGKRWQGELDAALNRLVDEEEAATKPGKIVVNVGNQARPTKVLRERVAVAASKVLPKSASRPLGLTFRPHPKPSPKGR